MFVTDVYSLGIDSSFWLCFDLANCMCSGISLVYAVHPLDEATFVAATAEIGKAEDSCGLSVVSEDLSNCEQAGLVITFLATFYRRSNPFNNT